MNYQLLRDEIDTDPLARGYSGMDSQQIADDINIIYRERNREQMTATEVLNTVNTIEWSALTDTEQRKIWDILHMGGDLNPFGNEAQFFISVFGAGSQTITDLAAARTEDISRATEINIVEVLASDVDKALAI